MFSARDTSSPQDIVTGEFQHNRASQAAGGVAAALGASPAGVERVMNAGDLASGGLSLGGGIAAGAKAAGRKGLETDAKLVAREVEEVAEATPAQTGRVTRSAWRKRQVNGRTVHQRDDLFDPNAVDDFGDTNLERMREGKAPIGYDGNEVNLHHLTQEEPGTLVEMSKTMHQDNFRALHTYTNQWEKQWKGPDGIWRPYFSAPSSIDRAAFDRYRSAYWQTRALDY